MTGSAPERRPLLHGIDKEDVPAAFKALGIDLDLYSTLTQMLSESELLRIELDVHRFLMRHARDYPPT